MSTPAVQVRRETVEDHRKSEELFRSTFWNLYQPGADEHFILHELRQSKDFVPELCLVATLAEEVVGVIAYSLASITRDGPNGPDVQQVLCFGPVGVAPECKGRGVGTLLIRESLARAKQLGFPGVVLLGYPQFYERFGFVQGKTFGLGLGEGRYPMSLQALELSPGAFALQIDDKGVGVVHFSPVFEVDASKLANFDSSFAPREQYRTVSQAMYDIFCGIESGESIPSSFSMQAATDSITRAAAAHAAAHDVGAGSGHPQS